jgi:gamma-glutamylcyclotransferase (GGCT)/AIG2-like uncharacterized protein YtfP
VTTPEHLFVYGTLRRSFDNDAAKQLRDCSRFLGEGTVRAELHQLDGYTGMVPDAHSTNLVRGEIFEIIEPAHLWPILEAYEGSEFECQTVEAMLDGGKTLTVRAYVYVR